MQIGVDSFAASIADPGSGIGLLLSGEASTMPTALRAARPGAASLANNCLLEQCSYETTISKLHTRGAARGVDGSHQL